MTLMKTNTFALYSFHIRELGNENPIIEQRSRKRREPSEISTTTPSKTLKFISFSKCCIRDHSVHTPTHTHTLHFLHSISWFKYKDGAALASRQQAIQVQEHMLLDTVQCVTSTDLTWSKYRCAQQEQTEKVKKTKSIGTDNKWQGYDIP